MKILTINCSPDFSYFTSKGLKINTVNMTIKDLKFTLKHLYTVKDQDGTMVDMYTPDVSEYLNKMFPVKQYDVVLVGWKPEDYGDQVKRTGGYTYPNKLPCGSRMITVRQDNPVNNIYACHELMHFLCNVINIDFKDFVPKDFMDMDSQGRPYYHNDDMNFKGGNFEQTWKGISPFLEKLNNLTLSNTMSYKYFSSKEVIDLKPELVSLMDKMRGECGFAWKITSGFRTPAENAKLKDSVSDSSHTLGMACDIACTDSVKRSKLLQVAFNNGIRRIGIGKDFIHLDISKTLPQDVCWTYYS